jgi:DNA-binding response OmpR family regulator
MPDDKVTLILDENPKSATLIRDTLISLGIKPVKIISDIDLAKASVLNEKLEMIILETKLKNESTLDLVNWLRKINNKNRTVPIIALTGIATKELVMFARDKGVTEFLLKPFTTATLTATVLGSLRNPRNFIISRNYSGPDRRRKKISPPDGAEKRSRKKAKKWGKNEQA